MVWPSHSSYALLQNVTGVPCQIYDLPEVVVIRQPRHELRAALRTLDGDGSHPLVCRLPTARHLDVGGDKAPWRPPCSVAFEDRLIVGGVVELTTFIGTFAEKTTGRWLDMVIVDTSKRPVIVAIELDRGAQAMTRLRGWLTCARGSARGCREGGRSRGRVLGDESARRRGGR